MSSQEPGHTEEPGPRWAGHWEASEASEGSRGGQVAGEAGQAGLTSWEISRCFLAKVKACAGLPMDT